MDNTKQATVAVGIETMMVKTSRFYSIRVLHIYMMKGNFHSAVKVLLQTILYVLYLNPKDLSLPKKKLLFENEQSKVDEMLLTHVKCSSSTKDCRD